MTEPQPHILVVDDHREIRDLIGRYLAKNGFRVTTSENAAAARKALKAAAVDLVVLDIMMPGEDGLSLCRFLRESSDTPVILLTAMAEDTDRVVGLEIGADDYVTKPFNPRELLARIRSVLRRTRPAPGAPQPDGGEVVFGPFTLDLGRRELTRDGALLRLTSGEFAVLSVLLRHPRQPLSRDRLMSLARGREHEAFERSMDVTIARLRRLLEDDPRQPRLIQTVWGVGYVFVPPEAAP